MAANGNTVAVLASIAWCGVDERGRIVFDEQFYASHAESVITTLGMVKDKVNGAILERVVTMSAYLASSSAGKTLEPVMPAYAYRDFGQAAQRLPAVFRATNFIAGSGYSYTYDVVGKVSWSWASSLDRVNWEEYLSKKKVRTQ